MTTVLAPASSLLPAFAAARKPDPAPPAAAAAPASTVLLLGSANAPAAVYDRPTLPEPTRSWSRTPDDAISALMGRNLGGTSLAARWRGLGGALLAQLAQQSGDYKQTLVQHAGSVAATDALQSARDSAVTVQLRIQTRSGVSVALSIAVNRGTPGVQGGLQVAVQATGKLSDAERKALGALADGFDQALAGLGDDDAPQLDLAGLLAYDDRQLSSVALTVHSPAAGDALRDFSLQADARGKRLQLQSATGRLALHLDAVTPLAGAGADQRQAAIAQYLAQFDAAGARAHVDADLLAQFKQAFAQLHLASAASDDAPTGVSPAALQRVAPLLSGLADFEASLEGTSSKTNDNGYLAEVGQARYEVRQQTDVQRRGGPDDLAVTQTRSAALKASTMRALGEAELDLAGGNYHRTEIDDASRGTRSVDTVDGKLVRAVADQDEQRMLRYAKLLAHRVVESHETPEHTQTHQDLLGTQKP